MPDMLRTYRRRGRRMGTDSELGRQVERFVAALTETDLDVADSVSLTLPGGGSALLLFDGRDGTALAGLVLPAVKGTVAGSGLSALVESGQRLRDGPPHSPQFAPWKLP